MTLPCAHVSLHQLKELWIHTGTACNLECPFCLEGSRPGDMRLDRIKPNEVKPYLEAAVAADVERFGFTGGEPLIVKDIVKILEHALGLRPCLVLSNGTAPLLKRLHQLQALKQQKHPLSFRISIDYPDQQQHDIARGWGNFQRAIEGLQLLHAQGFEISIARQMSAEEDIASVAQAYRQLLRKAHLPEDTLVMRLPDFGRPGMHRDVAVPPDNTMNTSVLMCGSSRMLVKQAGQLRLYACPFTDDDLRFDVGATLEEALSSTVSLQHHRCEQCVKYTATYSG